MFVNLHIVRRRNLFWLREHQRAVLSLDLSVFKSSGSKV